MKTHVAVAGRTLRARSREPWFCAGDEQDSGEDDGADDDSRRDRRVILLTALTSFRAARSPPIIAPARSRVTLWPMPVVVAVDFGEKRIGLATSDASGLLATPRVTLRAQERRRPRSRSSPGSAARRRPGWSSSGSPARPTASRAPLPRASAPSPARFARRTGPAGRVPRRNADLRRGRAAPAAAARREDDRPDGRRRSPRGLPARTRRSRG